MKLQVCALAGVALFFPAQAQVGAGTTDPVVAAQQAQQQAQMEYQNQLTDLNSAANNAKEGLLSQRGVLSRSLQECFIQKNEAEIQAGQQADDAKQQAMSQLVQGSMQGLGPLMQNFGTANNMGKQAAIDQKNDALKSQRLAAQQFKTACAGTTQGAMNVTLNDKATNASSIKTTAQIVGNSTVTPTGHTGAPIDGAVSSACRKAGLDLLSVTGDAESAIKESIAAESSASGNNANLAMAALATGVQVYSYSQAKKGAEAGLEDSKRINALNYDSCQQGVRDEAAEIDRQLANIDRQLAIDRERLAQQFAQFKLNVPSNIQSKALLNVDEGDDLPVIGAVGGAVAATKFSAPENPFGNLGKDGGGAGAGSGGGAAGSGAGGGGGDDKAGWGFTNPYETNNPGALYTLPLQPDKAGLIAGADGGDFGGGGANPFGDGFLGFEDPFGNLAGAGGAALAQDAGGNGFIELALKTRRRVYAHLGELLGQPRGTKVSKDEKKTPERKISSVRD